jgi:ABC-type lipoprotein export system ATPase subunit
MNKYLLKFNCIFLPLPTTIHIEPFFMLQANNLTYTYDQKTTMRFPDIGCGKGEQWLLLGQSGSGKTTLLHLLGGLLRPLSGEVRVDGTSLSSLSKANLDNFRGQHIGIVFQRPHFVQALNLLENIHLAAFLANRPIDPQRTQFLLENLQIAHKAKSRPNDLSQGEQQRAAIARALLNGPSVILADEPTSALDDTNALKVARILEEQAIKHNASLLIVTHDARLKDHFANSIQL